MNDVLVGSEVLSIIPKPYTESGSKYSDRLCFALWTSFALYQKKPVRVVTFRPCASSAQLQTLVVRTISATSGRIVPLKFCFPHCFVPYEALNSLFTQDE